MFPATFISAHALREGRKVRSTCLTRKAAQFAGSQGGGVNLVIAATLTRTAIRNGVNPQTWQTDVLERIVRDAVRPPERGTRLP